MINVSNEFTQYMENDKRNFLPYIDIFLKDGTELNLDASDIWEGGFSIEESVSNDGVFSIGCSNISKLTVTLNNIDEQFSQYDFDGATVNAYIGLQLSNSLEKIRKGVYVVDESTYNNGLITIECLDNMTKLEVPFNEISIVYPTKIGELIRAIALHCGVVINGTIENEDFQITNRDLDIEYNCRAILSYLCQLIGCYAIFDEYGRLNIKWYDTSVFDGEEGWNYDRSNCHYFSSFSSFSVSVDDVVITGIKIETNDEEYSIGTEGYVLGISENPFIDSSNANQVLTYLGNKIIGMKFRPFSVSTLIDPTIQPGDCVCLTDLKSNEYQSYITHNKFTIGDYSIISCEAETPLKNRSNIFSQQTANYVKNRQETERQISAYDIAVQNLTSLITQSFGIFKTEEKQENGSVIYYLHDKPTIEESQKIWKMTADAFSVSTDGGNTWNAGIDASGNAVVNILSAIGINFDWGVGGTLIIQDEDGNETAYIDADTGTVRLSVESLRISGKTVEQIAQEESASTVNDFVDAVYNPAIQNLQQQIDGQIMTYYEDYEPTLENEPAVEWTTEELKQQHEGDLFYWKSKGYSYRFFKDGDTWKWQMVQDTDITLALQQASAAQDTADQKRRVFVTQPTPPYDVGDLWVGNTSSDLMRCQTARKSGNYAASDWVKATKYTDDTVANQALAEAQNARNLNIILDNEYQGIPTDSEGNYTTFPECKTTVQVLYGHADISANCSYSISKSSSVAGNWDLTTRTYTITGITADEGYVDITATYLSMYTVSKRFSVAKIRAGADGQPGQDGQQGEDGVGVSSISSKYAVSSSNTTAPTTWYDVPQTMTETNKYLWTYDIIAYTNGTQDETDKRVIGVYGNTGASGEAGTSVESITTEFYLSTSKETPTGGSWTTTMPTWSNGMYLWMRSKIVYINPSSTEYTAPYCDSSWEAVNEIEIGGRNLIRNSSGNLGATTWSDLTFLTFYNNGGVRDLPYFNVTVDLTNFSTRFMLNNLTFPKQDVYGETFTISGYIRVNNSVETEIEISIRCLSSSASAGTVSIKKSYSSSEWTYFTATKAITVNNFDSGYPLFQIAIASGGEVDVDFCALKAEKGNTPTDWTPAPEDTKSIESYTTTYQAGSSGTTPPTGTWSSTPVSTSDTNPYLWVRNIVSYSNGTNDEFYSVAAQGSKGLKGDPGEQGIQGEPGENGQTSYLHIAYANNATGTSGFSTTDSTNKLYIGQYTDFSATDSTDPSKYSWTKIKGDTGDTGPKGEKGDAGASGAAGRTYFIELSSTVAVRGENGTVRPASITANAYYRDGSSTARTSYSGRWRVQTSTNGTSWTTVTTSSTNEAAKTYTVSSLAESINYIRFVLYAAGGTTTQLDMQTIPIVVDISSLSHEDVFNLLTNNGQMEGIFEEGGQLYINGSYIQVDDLSALNAKIAGFTITDTSLTANVEIERNYNTEDRDFVTDILIGLEGKTLTDEQFEYYDANNDRQITILDVVAMQNVILGTQDDYSKGKFSINTNSFSKTIVLETTEGYQTGKRTLIGVGSISCDAGSISELTCTHLEVGGTFYWNYRTKQYEGIDKIVEITENGSNFYNDVTITKNLSVSGNISGDIVADKLSISGNTVTDYVVASGSSGIWRYIKWNSGLAMCWTDSYKSTDNFPSTQWGAVWSSVDFTFGTYPFAFANAPVCFCNKIGGDTNDYAQAFGWMAQGYGNQTAGTCLWDFIRPDNTVLGHPQFRMVAIGRWK